MKRTFVCAAVQSLFWGLLIATPVAAQTLKHFYDFNGTTIVDRVGGIHGSLFSGASVSQGSLHLDGVDDYAALSGKIIPLNGAPFSVFMRFNAGSQPLWITEIISQGYSGGPGFYIGQVGGQLRLTDNFAWGETQTSLPSASHALLLTSGAGGTKVYMDGTLVFFSSTALSIADNGSGSNTFLGKQFGAHGEWFLGSIDELKVFDNVVGYAQASAACPIGSNEVSNFSYDALGRLTSVSRQRSGGSVASNYAYDKAGNRVSASVQVTC